ncbi:MAG TPA: NADH-quinone oxidoreductase subunit NuoN [Candidatus Gastranaerophilales bacterium]|nr:NADH-quinone oxidoreductase subunit NuoN [Candidatus Gastranaerophilales bacterium]
MELLNDIKNVFLPEFIITLFALLALILSFSLKKEHQNLIFFTSVAGVIFALYSLMLMGVSIEQQGFYESFVSNNFTAAFRVIILIGTGFTLFLSKDYIASFGKSIGEFYFLLLTATLGGMILCGANDLVAVFIGLETLSISSFALCGYTKSDILSNEAALKYLIFGAVASAIMLYGFSFLYGITGETNFTFIASFIQNYNFNSLLMIAFLMILAGFGFKISAVPFQAWTPDVYQGAPIPVAAYLSVVSKTAGFAALIRFVDIIFVESTLFAITLGVIAVITMTVGNLMALDQQNIRRLLAYSSIAHAGYILLGLAIMTNDGITAIIFYLITYLFMNFGVWAGIELFALATGKDNIDDLNGLAYKHRYFAFGLVICILSLAGIPITAGFFSKFYLFKAVISAGYEYTPLLVIALINTVVAIFYYMRVIKAIYVMPDEEVRSADIFRISFPVRLVMLISVVGALILGIFASPFIEKAKTVNISGIETILP